MTLISLEGDTTTESIKACDGTNRDHQEHCVGCRQNKTQQNTTSLLPSLCCHQGKGSKSGAETPQPVDWKELASATPGGTHWEVPRVGTVRILHEPYSIGQKQGEFGSRCFLS